LAELKIDRNIGREQELILLGITERPVLTVCQQFYHLPSHIVRSDEYSATSLVSSLPRSEFVITGGITGAVVCLAANGVAVSCAVGSSSYTTRRADPETVLIAEPFSADTADKSSLMS